MSVIPAPGMLSKDNSKFKASLGCIARPCINKTRKKSYIDFPSHLVKMTIIKKTRKTNAGNDVREKEP
jgi:hypothetical protein